MLISKNILKKNIGKPGKRYLTCMFILMILVFHSGKMYSQVVTDSLKVDTSKVKLTDLPLADTITGSQAITPSDTMLKPEIRKVSPARATIYSAILPGLGQVYNGKYWKVPIIYSAFAGIIFMAGENNYKYNQFKTQYKKSLAGETLDEPYASNYTQESLLQRKDYYKRNRDFQIILGALAYLLNILDANVDAHLMDYDINPDLTLQVKPEVNNYFVSQNFSNKTGFGIKFVLSMH
jgi:hypothetical protein